MPKLESLCSTDYEDETDPETGLPKALNTVLDGSAISLSKYASERSQDEHYRSTTIWPLP